MGVSSKYLKYLKAIKTFNHVVVGSIPTPLTTEGNRHA
jgi:hypothetical protein